MVDLKKQNKEKKKLLSAILVFTTLMGITLFLINFIFYTNMSSILVLSFFSLFSLTAFILNKAGYYKTALIIIFIASISTITVNMVMGIGIMDPGIMALPVFIVISSFFLGRRSIVYITLTSVLILTGVGILEITGIHQVPYPMNAGAIVIYDFILIFSGFFVFFIIRDNETYVQKIKEDTKTITSQKEKLALSLEEKNILLKEIHHRIKNNMQIISSLLMLQSYKIKSKDDKKIFEDCHARINTMALVHEQLCLSDNLRSVNFKYYFEQMLHQYDEVVNNRNIRIQFDLQELEINLSQAIPIAMIINELISNSIKYAFNDKKGGEISISLKSLSGNEIELIVVDNGCGFNEKEISKESIGLYLVDSLSNQLNAKKKTNFDNKTEYSFIFIREN